MYDNKTNRCDNRIVNIYQLYVRPIVRGKDKTKVEFGAKLSVKFIYQPYHVRPIVRGKDKTKVEFGAKLSVSEFDGMCVK